MTAEVVNPTRESDLHSMVSDVSHSGGDEDGFDALKDGGMEETIEFDSSCISDQSTKLRFHSSADVDRRQASITAALTKQLGRYSIQDVLGVGGEGVVYRGLDETPCGHQDVEEPQGRAGASRSVSGRGTSIGKVKPSQRGANL
ncbi:hypothetical protein [Stieleria bergensis]|uniref:hypothetical protein n=1 Tax=Stieleria bergensis TaxID=2528025 RepID=UPI003AF35032